MDRGALMNERSRRVQIERKKKTSQKEAETESTG